MQPRRHRSGASAARRALLLAAAVLAAAHCASAARLGPLGAASYKSRHQDGMLRVLALGDSITQGAVPSENINHPYTGELKRRLQQNLGEKVEVTNGGVGGAGIYAVGFHNPVTLVPWAKKLMSQDKYDWVICMVGINDLLRVGKSADEVSKGLLDIYRPALESGSNIMAIAPLPAPGFVSKDDVKEAERVKLNEEIKKIGVWWNTNHPDGPTFLFTDLGFDGPMDFWKMSIAERAQWLDDGLHLTPKAYDKMGDFIANALLPHLKK